MIITFCGHSRYYSYDNIKEQFISVVREEIIKDPFCSFYLGGYGNFDNFCYSTLKELKKEYTNIKLIFVTPYLEDTYLKNKYAENYDEVIYPPLEKSLKPYAILDRNKWMVTHSDLVIAYVAHDWGGAAKTLDYAIRKKIPYINLCTE